MDETPDTAPAGDSEGQDVVQPIDHAALTREDLPHPRDPFEEVVQFAYTFDAYAEMGMQMCGEMANRGLKQFLDSGELQAWLANDLVRLRSCLYFEARRWILLEREPDTRALIYVHALIDAIGNHIDERAANARDAARSAAPAR